MNAKETGSYYTPHELVMEMVNCICKRNNIKTVLEPSAGDGRFIDELIKKRKFIIDSVELIDEKAKFIKEKYENDNVKSINMDFIEYSINCKKQYDLIIGNPPYISKKLLNQKQKDDSKSLYKLYNLPPSSFNNIWVSFILGSIKLLKDDGTIFFVLPHEFLQVDYSKSLRNFLEEKFKAIELFIFNQNVFNDIQQDVCLVYMSNNIKKTKSYIKYNIVNKVNISQPISFNKIMRNKPLDKWSNSIINDEEIELLKRLNEKCIKIRDIGNMSPGVVTGANSYFILKENFVKLNNITKFTQPIIPKSTYVKNKIILKENDFNEISKQGKRVYLLKLNGYDYKQLPNSIKKYILEGENKEINTRYKCSVRHPWYYLPESKVGDIVFFKRYDKVPRLIINQNKFYTTDIGYNIQVKDNYDKDSIVFCFYNSLSLSMCEYNGRFYGGGVSELTPNEFREVALPYKKIDEKDIRYLDDLFRKNESINNIINYINRMVLKDIATDEEIEKLEQIRKRYLNRRLKVHE